MKTELSLTELAQEIERQNNSKEDFVVPTDKLRVIAPDADKGPLAFSFETPKAQAKKGQRQTVERVFEMNRYTTVQVAQHVKAPMPFVEMMLGGTPRERAALAEVFESRLNDHPAPRMVRTMATREGDPFARAFLSDRYRRLDNFDLASAVLPVLGQLQGLRVESSAVTEEHMYIKAIWPDMTFDVGETRDNKGRKVNDIVQAGIVVSNSEVGAGALRVEPLLFRLVCVNGMIAADSSVRKHHVGRASINEAETGDAFELYTEGTLALDDAAFFGKVVDTTRAVLTDRGKFGAIVSRFLEAKGEPVTGHVQAAVEVLQKRVGLSDEEGGGILNHLITGGDLSKFGVVNAITRYSQDVPSYTRATELERMGGEVLSLPPADWRVIAEAQLQKAEPKGRRRRVA
jgi:hypothetical protein